MFALRLNLCVRVCILLTACELCAADNPLESQTKFIFYNKNNVAKFVSTSRNDSLSERATGCNPNNIYALIVHGLNESCDISWAQDLRRNLIAHRGGCIICMDYSAYSEDYGFLVLNFRKIAEILTAKLFALQKNFFSSCTAYLFGFSFGARLIPQSGKDFGPQLIEKVHLCEAAGPDFDNVTTADPKLAALDTQCIHTAAGGLGTVERRCHQDWLMGDCGISQVAARPPPNGNHGLCPVFYNSAFENYFPAMKKIKTCNQTGDPRDGTIWPRGFRMGYYQQAYGHAEGKNLNQKNFYAETTKDAPFTPFA